MNDEKKKNILTHLTLPSPSSPPSPKGRGSQDSVWISLLSLDNADVMVGKLEVSCGRPNLWHVTGNAFLRAHFAANRFVLCSRVCRLILRSMTRQALAVVISNLTLERCVGIVTSGAAYAAVIRIALAVKDAVRLKADVVDLHAPEKAELIAAAMTGGAKFLGQFIATEPAGVKDQVAA